MCAGASSHAIDEDGSDDDTYERERLLSVVATPLTARNCRGHPSPERKAAREQDECGTDGHAGHARACQKNAKGERILSAQTLTAKAAGTRSCCEVIEERTIPSIAAWTSHANSRNALPAAACTVLVADGAAATPAAAAAVEAAASLPVGAIAFPCSSQHSHVRSSRKLLQIRFAGRAGVDAPA